MKCNKCPFFWVDSESVDVCDIYYRLGDYFKAGLSCDEEERERLCPLKDSIRKEH